MDFSFKDMMAEARGPAFKAVPWSVVNKRIEQAKFAKAIKKEGTPSQSTAAPDAPAAADPSPDEAVARQVIQSVYGTDSAWKSIGADRKRAIFEASKLLGPGFQSAIDPKKWDYVASDHASIRGVTVREDAPDKRRLPVPALGSGELDVTVEPGHSAVFGRTLAPTTLAHELRHQAGIHDEMDNRLYDAMYADSEDAWKQAVGMWLGYKTGFDKKDGKKWDLAEAERDLREKLGKKSEARKTLLGKEWDIAPEGAKPKYLGDPSMAQWLMNVLLSPREEYQNTDLPMDSVPNMYQPTK